MKQNSRTTKATPKKGKMSCHESSASKGVGGKAFERVAAGTLLRSTALMPGLFGYSLVSAEQYRDQFTPPLPRMSPDNTVEILIMLLDSI